MINIGIIGFGKMGMLHGAILNGSHKVNIVAICDKSWVMRYGFKKVYPQVKTFSNVDAMLKKTSLDAVIIATPTFNHVESALKCIENGCHLFIEKPLTSSYDKAKKIYSRASKSNCKIQIGFCNRYAPSIAKGKALLDSGIIGNPISADAYMYIADVFEQHSGWRYSKSTSGGGVLMDFGIHMLDQLYWYFGLIDNVTATAKKLYSAEVEDELEAAIQFKKGMQVNFKTSWSKEAYRKSYARVEIYGDAGKMIVTDQTLEIYNLENELHTTLTYPELYDGCSMDIGGILYSKQMDAFLDYLEKDTESITNLKSAVYIQYVIEEIYKSAASGKTVLLRS